MTKDEALELSIQKWRRNSRLRNPLRAEITSDSCPLCDLFLNGFINCKGCPIQEHTKLPYCIGSPWLDASNALRWWSIYPDNKRFASEFRAAARTESEFLESLRETKP